MTQAADLLIYMNVERQLPNQCCRQADEHDHADRYLHCKHQRSILAYIGTLTTSRQHWHGFFQHGTNWADGVPFLNQCPIVSGNSFLYNFNAPDQAGKDLIYVNCESLSI